MGGHEKAGPRRSPLLKRLRSVYLPNDPARQKATGHKQSTRAKRYQRGTTRLRQRTASCSSRRSGATATAATAATAATSGCGRSRTSGPTSSGRTSSASSGVDVHVLTSGDAIETREYLVLADAKLLRDASEILLVIGVVLAGRSGLDLVTVHVLDAATDGSRLGESRSGGGQNHGHNRGQQHYFPQNPYLLYLRTTLRAAFFHP
jgi:hypothetical protein